MAIYQRHTPETTVFYQTIARVWPGLFMEYAASDAPLADHIETEFERFLRCGILPYGFIRLKCTGCQGSRILGFSCKGQGFCASCGARRMEQAADRLEREVWPHANARQFVLPFPHQVRHWLANTPELLADVILIVTSVIQDFYEDSTLRGMDKEQVSMPTDGAITFVQCFASSLALNTHLHMAFLDGVYGIDPELCTCGSRMRIEDVVTDGETITEVLVAIGLVATPPPRGRRRAEAGELSYLFED